MTSFQTRLQVKSLQNNVTIKVTQKARHAWDTQTVTSIFHTFRPGISAAIGPERTMLRDESVGSRSARYSATVSTVSNKVLVAVKAERVISKNALAWALTHVVHSSDCITLLAVYCGEKTGKLRNLLLSSEFWSFYQLFNWIQLSKYIMFVFWFCLKFWMNKDYTIVWLRWYLWIKEIICILYIHSRQKILEFFEIGWRLYKRTPGKVAGADLWNIRVLCSDGTSIAQSNWGNLIIYQITNYNKLCIFGYIWWTSMYYASVRWLPHISKLLERLTR